MSWSDRRTLLTLLAGLPLTAACGFSPVHAPGGAGAALRGRVRADDPGDRDAFALVERIEERLGRPETAAYRLSYAITTDADPAARAGPRDQQRGQVSGQVRFELHRMGAEDAAPVAEGTASAFAGYSTSTGWVANRAAEEDARRRLMRMLADRIVTLLYASRGVAEVAEPEA